MARALLVTSEWRRTRLIGKRPAFTIGRLVPRSGGTGRPVRPLSLLLRRAKARRKPAETRAPQPAGAPHPAAAAAAGLPVPPAMVMHHHHWSEGPATSLPAPGKPQAPASTAATPVAPRRSPGRLVTERTVVHAAPSVMRHRSAVKNGQRTAPMQERIFVRDNPAAPAAARPAPDAPAAGRPLAMTMQYAPRAARRDAPRPAPSSAAAVAAETLRREQRHETQVFHRRSERHFRTLAEVVRATSRAPAASAGDAPKLAPVPLVWPARAEAAAARRAGATMPPQGGSEAPAPAAARTTQPAASAAGVATSAKAAARQAGPAIDPAMVSRLADDVMRRLEQKLRIERERHGL